MRASVFAPVLLVVVFLLTSCQGFTQGMQTGIVPPENRADISMDKGKGVWQGRYLSVDYSYSRGSGNIDLAGAVQFEDSLALGFTVLHDFRISARFLDANGRVLETRPITTDRGSFSPIPFRKTMSIPSSAVAMSFTYEGTAIESGGDDGGGISRFWE